MRILRERAGRVFNSAVAPVVYHNIVDSCRVCFALRVASPARRRRRLRAPGARRARARMSHVACARGSAMMPRGTRARHGARQHDAETHIITACGGRLHFLPTLRYCPVFAIRAGCGGRDSGRDKHAKPAHESDGSSHTSISFTLAAPVLFLGPSSGRHHGMPFFGFLFFFHPGSVWMAPPRLSCRSIDLSWTPSACESCSGW